MPETIPTREGFSIDEATHEIYRKLAKEKDITSYQSVDDLTSQTKSPKDIDSTVIPFSSMKDVFIWATCIGFIHKRRKPITGKRRLIFRWAQCNTYTDVPVLKSIAITETGDISILSNLNEIMMIAEEYANAGIYELKDTVLEGKDLPLWNLITLIRD